ncbi:DUF2933 domain-containing protein [Siccirubricoccus phaeus]|uniref:DUF2933 domain-containing protein n=1 Tax=Siccirubricoccus phaeus TaxID=2595053 RepID=UPI0011F11928|nr:DUF2933 domain-containing protein [Siccirubricoccus phaeus]
MREHYEHTLGALTYLLLACPLMRPFAHHGHGGHRAHTDAPAERPGPAGRWRKEDRGRTAAAPSGSPWLPFARPPPRGLVAAPPGSGRRLGQRGPPSLSHLDGDLGDSEPRQVLSDYIVLLASAAVARSARHADLSWATDRLRGTRTARVATSAAPRQQDWRRGPMPRRQVPLARAGVAPAAPGGPGGARLGGVRLPGVPITRGGESDAQTSHHHRHRFGTRGLLRGNPELGEPWHRAGPGLRPGPHSPGELARRRARSPSPAPAPRRGHRGEWRLGGRSGRRRADDRPPGRRPRWPRLLRRRGGHRRHGRGRTRSAAWAFGGRNAGPLASILEGGRAVRPIAEWTEKTPCRGRLAGGRRDA